MIYNENFISTMNASAKMISASVKIDGVVFSDDDIVSVNPYFDGALLCSVMRCCKIEVVCSTELFDLSQLKGKTVSNVRIGVKQENDSDFSYIAFGDYKIYSCEYREGDNALSLICYDNMLDSMVPYNLEISADITVKQFLSLICQQLGWTLADVQFANENTLISAAALNSYLPVENTEDGEAVTATDSAFTFRDVLDDIAELMGGNLVFKNDGILYPLYPAPAQVNDTTITLSADNQKELTFGKQFGPVNSVSLVDTQNGNTILLDDKDSIALNGECQITIKDNPLINSDRNRFISGIFNKLSGLSYTPYEFTSFGFGYLEFGDMFNIEDKSSNVKKGILLSDSFLASLTMSESASAKAYSADSDTQYSVADPIDKVKVEVKKLHNANTKFNNRLLDATRAISKTTDGHAVLVNLEENKDTHMCYLADGEADTFVVSEYPAVAPDGEKDFNDGRVIRINYNGIAVSTTGINGPYTDFALYYDADSEQYRLNANDITAGTLTGINIQGGGLKITYPKGNGYVTFEVASGMDSADTEYLLRMYDSDKDGNPGADELTFGIDKNGSVDCFDIRAFGRIEKENRILWSGARYMTNETSQQISFINKENPSNEENYISSQTNGIVLVFSTYNKTTKTPNNANFHEFFVPKAAVTYNSGKGHRFLLMSDGIAKIGSIYLYISDNSISGHVFNGISTGDSYKASDGTTKTAGKISGMDFDNSNWVLRYVIGV